MGILPRARASVGFGLLAGVLAFVGSRGLASLVHGWYAQATLLLTFSAWVTALFIGWGAMSYINEQALWGRPAAQAATNYVMEFVGLMFVVLGVAPFALHAVFRDGAILYASPVIGWVCYGVLAGLVERGGGHAGQFVRGRARISSFRIR